MPTDYRDRQVGESYKDSQEMTIEELYDEIGRLWTLPTAGAEPA